MASALTTAACKTTSGAGSGLTGVERITPRLRDRQHRSQPPLLRRPHRVRPDRRQWERLRSSTQLSSTATRGGITAGRPGATLLLLAGDLLVVHTPVSPSTTIALEGSHQRQRPRLFPQRLGLGHPRRRRGLPRLRISGARVGIAAGDQLDGHEFPADLHAGLGAGRGTPVAGVSNVIWDSGHPRAIRCATRCWTQGPSPPFYTVNGATSRRVPTGTAATDWAPSPST